MTARGRNNPCAGFTLVELMVVIVLVTLLSGLVVMQLGGLVRGGRMQDAVQRWQMFDHTTRRQAALQGQTFWLVRDHASTSTQRISPNDPTTDAPSLTMPRGYAVDAVWKDGVWHRSGQTVLTYSSRGFSPDYAVSITGPNEQAQLWLCLGLTGQWVQFEDLDDLEELHNTTRATWPDAG